MNQIFIQRIERNGFDNKGDLTPFIDIELRMFTNSPTKKIGLNYKIIMKAKVPVFIEE